MKAAILRNYGGQLVIADVDRPTLPADSVMAEVHASSCNPIDAIIMCGGMREQMELDLPWIVGYDVSGVVTEVGSDVDAFDVGDEVFARADGAQANTMAEYAAIKASDLALKPENVDHATAAGIPLVGLTAWQALFDKGQLEEGQRVLIHGGSGGVGTLAIQIAKDAGAWVATTASGENADLVRDLGADLVIDYREQRFEDEIEDVDLVFDMLGGETLERSFDVVKRGGRVVSIKGEPPEGLADERGVDFDQFFMQPDGAQLATITGMVEAGTLRPIVDRTFPLAEVAAAYERLDSGDANGKIIVTVR